MVAVCAGEDDRRDPQPLERERSALLDVVHELRTPLTSALLNLELLVEQLQGEPADMAEAALRSTQRMDRLVDDLLLLARAEGPPTHPRTTVDLAEVLRAVDLELRPLVEAQELSVDPGPAVVMGERDELHRLVLNLVENSLWHTPAGTQVRVSSRTEGDDVVVTVEDDGPGIPPDLERDLFDRFTRGSRTGSGGSGLGLAIVRALAEAHGGTVSLVSEPGREGAKFVVRLPAAARAETATDGGSTITQTA